MKYKNFLPILILSLISLIPILNLLNPGLPVTHDGQDHVARIANFYQNLSEGNVIPRWAGNLNWGYGNPILMFLYPLPSYVASLFHFIGFSFIDSTKLVFGTTYIFSGLAMYLWVNTFLRKRAAFISSLLYLFAPYRFIDLYVRGAIGEHVAFVFPPLVLYFLLKLSKKYSYWYVIGGLLSFAGLILSHNAISLIFLPVIFLYALYLLWQSNGKRLLVMSYGLLVILGFGLAAFFWIPAFFEGKHTLRDFVTGDEYASRFVSLQSFIYGQWNYGITGQFTTQIGIVHWIAVIFSLPVFIILRKKKNHLWAVAGIMFSIFIISLFLMTETSKPIWEILTTLQKFQFPWRFLSISVFASSMLGGLVIFLLPRKFQLVTCYLLLITLLWFNKDYWHAKDYQLKAESFYTGIYDSTTDTGESSPKWSVRFMEKRPKDHMEIIDGDATTKERSRTSTKRHYQIEAEQRTRFRENTLFFPGWEVFVDGKKVDIEFQDQTEKNRGLMTFFVEQGKHNIEVKFRETKLRFIADLISIATLVIIFVYGIIRVKPLWRRFQ